ncbi:hypothetical protein XBJ1_3993 [Xenorhabdus bovienii SS-2004]|uniref:Uncharacterized protein n=1 Tax=Xenorhabdus bovienii (strain SS-2004) TaxID=406818 RepID=D3V632_XENBS|nr:hypothetical protein XBJ1_3993 [Xenorhabdus bovienii SS-2004]
MELLCAIVDHKFPPILCISFLINEGAARDSENENIALKVQKCSKIKKLKILIQLNM